MKTQNLKKLWKWPIMVVLVITWGSSYILMKRGLEEYSAMQVGALRISIASIVLFPIALSRIRHVPKSKLLLLVLSGFLGNGIPAFLFTQAQLGIDSEIAGILNSVAPLFALMMGVLFFKLETKWFNIIGVFIGLFGAVGLLSVGIKGFDTNLSYGIYIIIATMLYGTNINIVKKYFKEIDSITITSIAFIVIGIFSLVFLLAATDFIVRTGSSSSIKALGYVVILAVLGTSIAGILYNY